jgi:SAM-dependent methyltransferase
MPSLREINEKTRRAYNLAAQAYHDLFRNEMNDKAYDRELLDRFARRFGPDSLVCDAGCGPAAHIGRYLADKGIPIVGVDISERCVELAGRCNPGMKVVRADIGRLPFADGTFAGAIAYYALIDTPRRHVGRIFRELHRVLKPGGSLLTAVKAGEGEGFQPELLGMAAEIWFTRFSEAEIAGHFRRAGFELEFVETRDPYGFEIQNERIFAIGRRK